MEEKWSVDKLDGHNWMTWKFQMRHLLLAKGLWAFVDGSEVAGESAQARTEFNQKSERAFSTIALAVCTSHLYLITSVDKPKDAWDALCSHFERGTLANKLFLKKQYFRTEMKEGTPIEAHLKHMKEITDKLASIGAPISEEDQVVTLLGSLPPSFSTVVTALEARGDDLKLSQVQQSLILEEMKLTERNGSGAETYGDHTSSAMVGSQGGRSSWKPRCYHCGQLGHFRRECPKRKGQMSYGSDHTASTAGEKCYRNPREDNRSELDASDNIGAFTASVGLTQMDKWLIDSGASSHMTWERSILTNYVEFKKAQKVGLGDGRTVDAVGIGNVHVNMQFKVSQAKPCVIYHVLYVPELTCNLFSVRAATERGNHVRFGESRCWIRDSSGKLCGSGTLVDKLYKLDCELASELHNVGEKAAMAVASCDMDLWHQRLGHLCEQQIKCMVEKKLASGIKLPKSCALHFCEGCVEGKMHRGAFHTVGVRSLKRLQLVHSDVCGPMPAESLGGHKYFVTFIDDYSRCCAVYFLKQKSEVFNKFKEFEMITTSDCGHKIEGLRTDNGGEYISNEFKDYLKSRGIRHELTIPYTPEQNGVAERLNRTLMESARSMMFHAGLSNNYWAEAIATAAHLRNRSVTTATNTTPYERWYDQKPDLTNLRVFGCMAYAHVPDTLRDKLAKKAEKVRFVGYSRNPKGYRLLNESTGKVTVRRDVVFNENDFGKGIVRTDDTVVVEMSSSEPCPSEVTPQQRPQRQIRPPIRYGVDEYADMASEDVVCHNALSACQILEPSTFDEALAGSHAAEWKQAADLEYESLMSNNTWELVELPADRKPIGCKWVFKVKYTSDGEVERFKGRLVAKGYAQAYGIDYEETFAPVVRFASIRTIIAFAVQNNLLIHQMDVVTAFLNGNLCEEIYMQQPDGYIQEGNEHLVCKLKKSLYGLKQSPRCWNTALDDQLKSLQFVQSNADPCVYVQRKSASLIIIAVYVDDLIVIANTTEEMQNVKNVLATKFKMKDMGQLHYCLGISIVQLGDGSHQCIYMHQQQYITNLLMRFRMTEANIVSTPVDTSVKLKRNDKTSKQVSSVLYQSIVGSLLYAAIATRPDIAQAVGAVSKFSSSPTEAHLTAAK